MPRSSLSRMPRAVGVPLEEAAWRYALLSLAIQRGDAATAMRYAAEREAAAQALETALAEGSRWAHRPL